MGWHLANWTAEMDSTKLLLFGWACVALKLILHTLYDLRTFLLKINQEMLQW